MEKHTPKPKYPENYLEQAVMWAVVRKLNVDLDCCRDNNYPTPYFVRLRPWKQPEGAPCMYTGWGTSFPEALKYAMQRYNADTRARMDWAWRPWNDGRVAGLDRDTPEEIPF